MTEMDRRYTVHMVDKPYRNQTVEVGLLASTVRQP